jgi:predicted porin
MANVGIGGPFGSLSAGLNLSPFIAAYTSTLGLAGNNFYVPALLMHRDGTVTGGTIPAFTGGTDADPAFETTGGFFIPSSLTYSVPSDSLGGLNASILYSFGGVPGSAGENRVVAGNIGYHFGSVKLVAAASDRDAQYRQYLIGTSFPLGPVNLAANFVHFDPNVGGSTSTFVIGADMEVMPSTRVGLNYAHNNSVGSPEIINLSAMYALSKSTKLYAAYNHATDGIPSSYSGNNDASGTPSLTQSGSSNAFMVGIQKGF